MNRFQFVCALCGIGLTALGLVDLHRLAPYSNARVNVSAAELEAGGAANGFWLNVHGRGLWDRAIRTKTRRGQETTYVAIVSDAWNGQAPVRVFLKINDKIPVSVADRQSQDYEGAIPAHFAFFRGFREAASFHSVPADDQTICIVSGKNFASEMQVARTELGFGVAGIVGFAAIEWWRRRSRQQTAAAAAQLQTDLQLKEQGARAVRGNQGQLAEARKAGDAWGDFDGLWVRTWGVSPIYRVYVYSGRFYFIYLGDAINNAQRVPTMVEAMKGHGPAQLLAVDPRNFTLATADIQEPALVPSMFTGGYGTFWTFRVTEGQKVVKRGFSLHTLGDEIKSAAILRRVLGEALSLKQLEPHKVANIQATVQTLAPIPATPTVHSAVPDIDPPEPPRLPPLKPRPDKRTQSWAALAALILFMYYLLIWLGLV